MFNFVRGKEYNEMKHSVERLVKEKQTLKEELEELKLKKRLEQEEIKHNTRLFEESKKQEVDNEKIKIQKKYQEDISSFKEQQRVELVSSLKEFHGKIESRFNSELSNLKETYQAIMARLPNVNLSLTKRLK